MKQILIAFVLFTLSAVSFAADNKGLNAAVIDGPNAVFTITAPAGWVLDTQSGGRDGLPAVLYPKGSSWDKSSVVMYLNNVPKDAQPSPILEDFIKNDMASFKKMHPKILIRDGKPLLVGDGRQTVLKEYSGDKWGNYEAVAYIAEDKTFTSFTLSAKKKDEYDKAFPAFKKFIESYTFLTSAVMPK